MSTSEQKGFCVLQFAKTEFVITVQRAFRIKFDCQPPNDNNIRRCEKLLRSPKKSVLRASRELAMPVRTVWEALRERLELHHLSRLQFLQTLKPTDYGLHAKFANDMQSLG
ncbi:DUF4817 domain-containing protein [Trichonephila clavipes]|nr:DUF4817 domain-containing protein [Trichonephila clavipes]